MIETLEDRKLMDGALVVSSAPQDLAPIGSLYDPKDLSPIIVGKPLLDKSITSNPNFNVPVFGIGNADQLALVSTVATATNTVTGQQFQEGGSEMIPGRGPSEITVTVNMNDLPPGIYTVTLEVFDGSMQNMDVQTSDPVNVKVTDPSVPKQNLLTDVDNMFSITG